MWLTKKKFFILCFPALLICLSKLSGGREEKGGKEGKKGRGGWRAMSGGEGDVSG